MFDGIFNSKDILVAIVVIIVFVVYIITDDSPINLEDIKRHYLK